MLNKIIIFYLFKKGEGNYEFKKLEGSEHMDDFKIV